MERAAMIALIAKMELDVYLAEKAIAFAEWGEAVVTPDCPMASAAWFAKAAPLLVVNPQAAAVGLTLLGTHYGNVNQHEIAIQLLLKSHETGKPAGDPDPPQIREAERVLAQRREQLREEIERREQAVRDVVARSITQSDCPEFAAVVQAMAQRGLEMSAAAKAAMDQM
jgi:hypothetical protein